MDSSTEALTSPWVFAIVAVLVLVLGAKLLGLAVRAVAVFAVLAAAVYLAYLYQTGAIT